MSKTLNKLLICLGLLLTQCDKQGDRLSFSLILPMGYAPGSSKYESLRSSAEGLTVKASPNEGTGYQAVYKPSQWDAMELKLPKQEEWNIEAEIFDKEHVSLMTGKIHVKGKITGEIQIPLSFHSTP